MSAKLSWLLAATSLVPLLCMSQALAAPCTLPNTISNGQPADATAVMSDLNALAACADSAAAGGSTNSVQIKNSGGTLSGVGPLTNGQLVIGSTGAAPVAKTLTAGAGISITNSAGAISIAATPGGTTNAIQTRSSSGGFSSVGPLANGQLVIGSTGNAPVAGNIAAGSGIIVSNNPGGVTISAASANSGPYREFGAFAPPNANTFTTIDSFAGLVPTVTNVANVGLNYSTPITANNEVVPGAYRAVPTSSNWTLTLRAKYAGLPGSYPQFGAFVKDTSGKMLGVILEGSLLLIRRNNSNTSVNANVYINNLPLIPDWFRINYDGTKVTFSVSWDSQNWMIAWSENKTDFLNGTLQLVGIGGISAIGDTSIWRSGSKTGAVITYWDIDDDPASGRTQ